MKMKIKQPQQSSKKIFTIALLCLMCVSNLSLYNSYDEKVKPLVKSNYNSDFSASTKSKAEIKESYGKLPISFEANEGQTDAQVKFLARGDGYSLFLTP